MDASFTLAGKTKVIPPDQAKPTRFKFMSLSEAEPNLGLPDGTGVYFLTGNRSGIRGWSNNLPDVNLDFIDSVGIRTNWLSAVSANIDNLYVDRLHAISAHIDELYVKSLTADFAKIEYLDVNFTTGFIVEGTLDVEENINVQSDLKVDGDSFFQYVSADDVFVDILEANHIRAKTKSFLVNHPTKKNKKLHYGSLESPYHGIRITGKDKIVKGICVVNLPEYICDFVSKNGVNIQLTNYKHNKLLYVDNINISRNQFIVKLDGVFNKFSDYEFFWSFTAIRKDVEKLIVEE